ncbi:hypothetical protein FB451DRAFT_1230368 [Mycena latifolia]|nr:hypothetical protein FB451DRAFT_1230368 [Mycena latifolia]
MYENIRLEFPINRSKSRTVIKGSGGSRLHWVVPLISTTCSSALCSTFYFADLSLLSLLLRAVYFLLYLWFAL